MAFQAVLLEQRLDLLTQLFLKRSVSVANAFTTLQDQAASAIMTTVLVFICIDGSRFLRTNFERTRVRGLFSTYLRSE